MTIDEYLRIIEEVNARGRYRDSWESLQGHPTPGWLKQKRFGLFIHWGVYSVPAFYNEWYPRLMYLKNSKVYRHHRRTYGSVDQFGYASFVPLFKAEKFDADEWMTLFRKSGAGYVMPVGEHHDGFKMYKSELNRWNAAEMGPRRDLLAEMHAAADRAGLDFLTSSHRAEHYWFLNGAGNVGVPNDALDEELRDFYGPLGNVAGRTNTETALKFTDGILPTEEWAKDWLASTAELIDRSRPKAVYFDWWVNAKPFRPYMKKFLAYYYNRAEEWGEEVTVFYKNDGIMQGCATFDVERGQLEGCSPYIWQNDTAIAKNSWGYTENNRFKTAAELIANLLDVVSKNGCFMLNVGPKADGTICAQERRVLEEMGAWLAYGGAGVYGSQPYQINGEYHKKPKHGAFRENLRYTARDIRYTFKDGKVYAYVLNPDKKSEFLFKSFGYGGGTMYTVTAVRALGGEAISWEQRRDGLSVRMPAVCSAVPVGFELTID